LWHLLAHFTLEESVIEESLCQRINDFLLGVIDYNNDVDAKRRELCGVLLEECARGEVSITPTALLQKAGLNAQSFRDWSTLRTNLHQKLVAVLEKEYCYQETKDVRSVPVWPRDSPILMLTGESGQGKTWQLAKLATTAALGAGLVVAVKISSEDANGGLSKAADMLWQDGLNHDSSLPMDRIAQRRREIVPGAAMPWLTVCVDDVQTARQARHLIERDWEGWGIRLAMTVPSAVGRAMQKYYSNRVHLFDVPDFTLAELREYLQRHKRAWEAVTPDVRAVLRRPLLAQLYCDLAADADWTPTNGYELFNRYGRRIQDAREQADFPHDLGRMRKLAATILQPQATYPWIPKAVQEAGIDDEAQKRLESIGWLRRLEDGRVEVWHDRLLNWAVAESLIGQWQAKQLSLEQLGEWLGKFCSPGQILAGKWLGYVPMDVLWLASCDRESNLLVDEVPKLIAALESQPSYGSNSELLYRELLPTLGTRILPALTQRVRETAAEDFSPYPQFVATTLVHIGAKAPDDVRTYALRLLDEQLPELQQTGIRVLSHLPCLEALDQLWELHKQHILVCFSTQEPQRHLRWFLYDISFAALCACVRLQPRWLANKIHSVASQSEPVSELAYQLALLEEPCAAQLWTETKAALFAKVPPEEPESLILCISRFQDYEELPRLEAWVHEEKGFASSFAIAALAKLAPESALTHLETIPQSALHGSHTQWLRTLLLTHPEQTYAKLGALMQTAGAAPWDITRLYQGQGNAIDSQTLDILLDALEQELEGYDPGTTPSTRPWLCAHLTFLANICRYELLQRFEARAGLRLEENLTSLACLLVGQNVRTFYYELQDARLILLKIGGVGITQLINCELADPDHDTRCEGLKWALIRPDAETRRRLRAIATSDRQNDNPRFPLEQSLAACALAALGEDEAVVGSILHWGYEVFAKIADVRHQQAPMSDTSLSKAVAALASVDEHTRANALLVLGISDRQDFIPYIREVLSQAPADSALALAAVLALDALGDKDPTILQSLATQLQIKEHKLCALRALWHIGTAEAWDVLAQHPPTLDLQLDSIDVRWILSLRRHPSRPDLGAKIIWEARKSVPPLLWPSEFFEVIGDLDDSEVHELLRDEAFPPAEIMANHENVHRMISAIRGLTKSDPEAAFQATQRALEHMQGNRELLPRLLLELDARCAIQILCNHIPRETNTLTRWAIGRALRLSEPSYPVHVYLQELLHSSDATIRASGAELCGWQRGNTFQIQLRQLFYNDMSEKVQSAALEALERQHNAQEIQRLLDAFTSANNCQRWSLLEAILTLGDPYILNSREDPFWLGRILEDASAALVRYVEVRLERRVKEAERAAKERDRRIDRAV